MNNSSILPSISFYNQDVIDLYDATWRWIEKFWVVNQDNGNIPSEYLSNPDQKSFNYFYSLLPSFFLVYSSEKYPVTTLADFFYSKQEKNGAIYSDYDIATGEKILVDGDENGICIPIFPWVEYNYYVKNGNKKRLKEVAPKLVAFYKWAKSEYMDDTGLFKVNSMNYITGNIDRSESAYPVEFNAAMAFYCQEMIEIGVVLKDKDMRLFFTKQYYGLKNRMNKLMWRNDFYYDLDANGQPVALENITAYFTLLAKITDVEKTETMMAHLSDPKMFGTENPFPTIPVRNKRFSKDGNGYYGGVSSVLTFIVVKAVEAQDRFVFARNAALKHIFCMLDAELLDDKKLPADVWEVYKPNSEGPSMFFNNPKKSSYELPRRKFLPAVGLITVTLLIENIIGFEVHMPLKTVTWTLDECDRIGIKNYYLKKNYISMECFQKDGRWRFELNNEKLYYLHINILSTGKKKNLSISAGKCSMDPEKF